MNHVYTWSRKPEKKVRRSTRCSRYTGPISYQKCGQIWYTVCFTGEFLQNTCLAAAEEVVGVYNIHKRLQELWQVLRATGYHIRGGLLPLTWPLLAASLTSSPSALPRDMQVISYILNSAYQAYSSMCSTNWSFFLFVAWSLNFLVNSIRLSWIYI